jgi:hypothetical protein
MKTNAFNPAFRSWDYCDIGNSEVKIFDECCKGYSQNINGISKNADVKFF